MAKKNIGATLSIKDGNFTSSIKKAITGIKDLKNHSTNATGNLKKMSSQSKSTGDSLAALAKKALGVAAAYMSFREVISIGKECVQMAQAAEQANVRLNTIMDQIPGITDKAKASVSGLCVELSKETTIGATAQKAGASQLASFQMSADSIEKLMPQLNNLAVANYGVNVTSDQMIQCANMLGKAYSGQTGALSRAGIVMTDAQAKMIKTGDDAQKSAALVEILNQNFGDLAKQMANTNEGRIIRIKNAINSVKTAVGTALLPVITNVMEYVSSKLPTIQAVVTDAITKVSQYLKPVADAFIELVDTVYEGVTTFIIPAIVNFKDALSPVIDNLSGMGSNVDWMDVISAGFDYLGQAINIVANATSLVIDNWNWLGPIVYGVVGAITAYNVAVGITNGLQAIVTATTGASAAATGAMTVAELAHAAAAGIASLATTALGSAFAFLTSPIFLVVAAIGAAIAIGVLLYKNWDSVCQGISAAWNWVKETAVMVWNGICDFFVAYWPYILGIFTGGVGLVVGLVIQNWDSVKNTTIKVFTTIKDKIVGIWDGIVGGIKGCINKIISAINGMIGGINKLSFDVPDWVPVIGGKKWGFNIPTIPMLAKGGITRTAGSVIVGERGPEMLSLPKGAQVTPLDRSSTKNENTFHINIYADGKSVESIIDELMPKLKLALANL